MRLRSYLLAALAAVNAATAIPQEARPVAPLLADGDLEAFVDGYMASYLPQAKVAGATIAFIEGDRIVLAKGYGYADLAAHAPVVPEATLFRIGSVSKLFVWTAVMQLVEKGQLDLLADVNDYLNDLEVPDAFGAPVNMVQLMTHTAGLDERVLGLFSHDESALRPLGEILRDELPRRVRPPGELSSYSNHGTALAMYVVEQISGVPWDEYLERNILEPLELSSTSFRQPLPEGLASRASKGYRFEDGELVERPFELVPLAPVGGASSTATDMARFMGAHLALGTLDGERILGEPAARLMQSPIFQHHAAVNGMAHGFMELDMNGERIIGHGGDTELFHTLLAFFPRRDIGVFVAFNSAGADYTRFLRAFVDRTFPRDEGAPPPTDAIVGLGRFAGVYRPIRYPHDTIAKIAALFQSVNVEVDGGELVTVGLERRRFVPVAPLVFREKSSSATLAFREDVDGSITHLFFSEAPTVAFERPPPSEEPNVVSLVLAGSALVILLAVVFWPAAALLRWYYRVSLATERRVPAPARWAAWLGCLMLAAFVLGLSRALSGPMEVVYGLSASTRALFWLPLGAAPLTLAAFFGAMRAWVSRRGSIPGRVAFTFVVAAMALLLWQLQVWNLLGFHF